MKGKLADRIPTPDGGQQLVLVIGMAVVIYLLYANLREQEKQTQSLAWQSHVLEHNAKAAGATAQALQGLEVEGEGELDDVDTGDVEVDIEEDVSDGQPKPAEVTEGN